VKRAESGGRLERRVRGISKKTNATSCSSTQTSIITCASDYSLISTNLVPLLELESALISINKCLVNQVPDKDWRTQQLCRGFWLHWEKKTRWKWSGEGESNCSSIHYDDEYRKDVWRPSSIPGCGSLSLECLFLLLLRLVTSSSFDPNHLPSA
jgi:hypothetical protein